MKRIRIHILFTLGLAVSAAYGQFTPGRVVVLQTAASPNTGNAGLLNEYLPSTANQASPAHQVALHSNGTTDDGTSIVFGANLFAHGMNLSVDGGLIVVAGYANSLATAIDSSTAANAPRVVATVSWDDIYARQLKSTTAFSGGTFRSVSSDGIADFWGMGGSGGVRYLGTNSAEVVVENNTGRTMAIANGNLYYSLGGAVNAFSGLPTFSTSSSALITLANTSPSTTGFSIPANPVNGSIAYVADITSTSPTTQAGVKRFTYDGIGTWTLAYVIVLPSSDKPQHIAVDYSGATPVIFATTATASANRLYAISDPGPTAGDATITLLATAPSGNVFHGVTLSPTQPALPVFTAQPSGTTKNYGETATFGPVSATGAHPNKWMWKHGTTTLTDGGKISGATTPTLTVAGVASEDAGSYYAIAGNNGGTTSSDPAVLNLAGSCISPNLVNRTNAAGTTADFIGGVSGCFGPIASYSWTWNGNPIGNGPGPSGFSTIGGATTAHLTISGVQDGDAGLYQLTLIDGHGNPSSSAATLTVVDSPSIVTPPANQDRAAGTTATFDVTASGLLLSYSWFKSPSSVALTNGPTGHGSTISGAATSHLVISNVQSADAGSYSVTVTNIAGSAPSDPGVLTVGIIPAVTIADSMSLPGSDAVFAATVTAGTEPFTHLSWRHNGEVVFDDGSHIGGATTTTLGITNVDIPDAGLYQLALSNSYGGVLVPAHLLIVLNTNKPNDVANLIVYEPFDYPTGPLPAASSVFSFENIISIYNRVTGGPAFWVNNGGGRYAAVVSWDPLSMYGLGPLDSSGSMTRNGGGLPVGVGGGGRFPYPGIECSTRNRWVFSNSGCNNHLHFGGVTNGSVYFSFVFFGDQGSAVNNGTYDVVAGFTSGSSLDGTGANANKFTYSLCTKADDSPGEANPGNVDGPGGWRFGVFKGGGVNIGATSTNGQWAPLHCWRGHPYFIVGCYKIVSGGTNATDDVVSLWVEPPLGSFGADEANVPPPDAGGMTTNWNANAPITEFAIRAANALIGPFSKSIADLRIGKTWASVTKPYHPTLSLTDDPSFGTLSWPAKDTWAQDPNGTHYGYQLESSGDLANWSRYSWSDYTLSDTNYVVITNKPIMAPQFWRLQYPPRSGAYRQY